MSLRRYVEAREHYKRGLEIAYTSGSLSAVPSIVLHLGLCEVSLEDYASAEAHMQEGLGLYSKAGYPHHIGESYEHLAQLEVARGDAHAAIAYLDRAAPLIEKADDRLIDGDLHMSYVKAYELLGDWRKVAHHERERAKDDADRKSASFRSKLVSMQEMVATEHERKETEMHKLRAEHAESDLANNVIALAAQTDLLDHFRNDLRKIVRDFEEPISAMKKIKEKLKELPSVPIDWAKFEAQFNEVHPEFRAKLSQKYPELTQMEQRIAAMVRIDLNSATIARLFCVTERAIEFHRLNLRKKLGLKKEESLPKFLSTIR